MYETCIASLHGFFGKLPPRAKTIVANHYDRSSASARSDICATPAAGPADTDTSPSTYRSTHTAECSDTGTATEFAETDAGAERSRPESATDATGSSAEPTAAAAAATTATARDDESTAAADGQFKRAIEARRRRSIVSFSKVFFRTTIG